ncbi:MAG: O-antigen ligase family protein [Paludibacteraceae bacterium]|nr:O-antigen ligase family protein [Paludibacteraceae bacterium]
MLRKIVVEKLYLFLIILAIGLWSALNMLQMEQDGLAGSDDSLLLKLLLGVIFVLVSGYLLVNYKYVHMGWMGRVLCVLSVYMAIARMAVLPPTVGALSYIYQPMRDVVVVLFFLFTSTLAAKSDELKDFFATWIIVGMLIIAYFFLQNWRFMNAIDEAHMGTAYWILFLMPILLHTPHKWLRYAGLILVGAILFASFKRGGILAFGCGLLAYLFVKEILIGRKFTKLIFFVIAIMALAIVFIVVDNALDNLFTERFMNIKDDGGSGRDQVWATTWRMIQQSEFEHLLFGHGHNSVLTNSPLRLSAHNDFLECIYDFGLFGSLFYFMLHISLIRQIFRNIRLRNPEAAIMAFTYSFFLILSLMSHVLIYPWLAFMGLSWGMGCAGERKALSV